LPLIFPVLWGARREGSRSPFAEVVSKVTFRELLSAQTPVPEAAGRNFCWAAGLQSVANGWQCRGLCCQLAGGGVAFCHKLVPSTCRGWQQQGPWSERWEGERPQTEGPGSGFVILLSKAGCCECMLSQSNSFQINWAGYRDIRLLHRGTENSASAGSPDGFWKQPQCCQAQLFSAMSFCHQNLGVWTLACKLSAHLQAHKLT
jgi:hypothetical protein